MRGGTEAVVEEQRPVDLHNLYMVGDKTSRRACTSCRRWSTAGPTPRRTGSTPSRCGRHTCATGSGGGTTRPAGSTWSSTSPRPTCSRRSTSSSAGPPATTRPGACVDAGLRLTSPDERQRIRDIVEASTASLSDADLDVLGYDEWLNTLELGIAAHHAGMVPPFKEAVETCFAEGLIRVVFATETLALGINMPARTVVIEKLSKFTGERHEFLTPGEYTQLTGRAGRRGIDHVGLRRRALVAVRPLRPGGGAGHQPIVPADVGVPADVQHGRQPGAPLHRRAGAPPAQPVASPSTRPTGRWCRSSPGSTSGGSSWPRPRRPDGAHGATPPSTGRSWSPWARPDVTPPNRARSVRPVPGATGRRPACGVSSLHGKVAVLTYAQRRNDAKLRVITTKGKVMTLGLDDFHEAPEVVGRRSSCRCRSPPTTTAFSTGSPRSSSGHGSSAAPGGPRPGRRDRPGRGGGAGSPRRTAAPTATRHVQAQSRVERLSREIDDLRRSVRGRTESLARRFDRVLRVLEAWGHLDGWTVTAKGAQLRRLYHECDLLIAECLADGVFDGLDPAVAGRAGVGVHLRAPQPRTAGAARLPVTGRTHPRSAASSS